MSLIWSLQELCAADEHIKYISFTSYRANSRKKYLESDHVACRGYIYIHTQFAYKRRSINSAIEYKNTAVLDYRKLLSG